MVDVKGGRQVRQPGGHRRTGGGLAAGLDRVLEVGYDRVGAPAADPGQPVGTVARAVKVASWPGAAPGPGAADRHGQIPSLRLQAGLCPKRRAVVIVYGTAFRGPERSARTQGKKNRARRTTGQEEQGKKGLAE